MGLMEQIIVDKLTRMASDIFGDRPTREGLSFKVDAQGTKWVWFKCEL